MPDSEEFKIISDRIAKSLQVNWNEFDQMINTYTNNQKLKHLDFQHFLQEKQTAVQQTEEEQKNVLKKERALQTRLELEDSQLKRLNNELRNLNEQENALPNELENKIERKNRAKKDVENWKKVLLEKEKERENMLFKIKRENELYQSLGCSIEIPRTPNQITITFTKINPLEPEREYSFAVCISPNNQFVIEDCIPEIPHDKLGRMVHELNATSAFGPFVRKMRQTFVDLCKNKSHF